MARFVPQAHHCAAPRHFVNGGIIATLIDCHCICTATAAAYDRAGRPIGSDPPIYLATAQLSIRYPRPAPIAGPLLLTAEITAAEATRFTVACTLEAQGKICATGEVVAVEVSPTWMQAQQQQQQ